jgi:peptide/nickel transport system ATP-binding protein
MVVQPEETTAPAQPAFEVTGDELLVVDDVKKHFPVTRGIIFQKQIASVKAVDGVSFTLRQGETLGIVGESGCGRRSHAASCAFSTRPRAGSCSAGATSRASPGPRCVRSGAR